MTREAQPDWRRADMGKIIDKVMILAALWCDQRRLD